MIEAALARRSRNVDGRAAALEVLRTLIGVETVLMCELAPRTGLRVAGVADLGVVRWDGVGFGSGPWRQLLDSHLGDRGIDWQAIHRAASSAGDGLSAEAALYRHLGIVGKRSKHAIVLDAPTMLGWVGTIEPWSTRAGDTRLLCAALPAFRGRLERDRRTVERALEKAGISLALDEAAWLVRHDGTVLHANAHGRRRLEQDRARVAGALRGCAAGRFDLERWLVTPFWAARGLSGCLVMEATATSVSSSAAKRAARRFGLTPAQARVLAMIARGATIGAIAAELSVAERTVEAYVTAILAKAKVGSRAALVVEIARPTTRPVTVRRGPTG